MGELEVKFMDMKNILIITILIILIGCLIYYIRKSKRQNTETRKIIEDKLRDDALNRAISNQIYEDLGCEMEPPSIPYEVDYSNKNIVKLETNKDNRMMLVIIEHSELSERKFIAQLKDRIYIGYHKDNNIIIKRRLVKDYEFAINRVGKDIYITPNVDTEVTLNRRNKYIRVQEQSEVKVKNGDRIIIRGRILELKIVT